MLLVASTVLFFVAKKRQWEVRKSLKRASRRLTGKGMGKGPGVGKTEEELRRARRQGAVRVGSPVPGKKGARDVEKGSVKGVAEIEMDVKPTKTWKAIMPPSWPGSQN